MIYAAGPGGVRASRHRPDQYDPERNMHILQTTDGQLVRTMPTAKGATLLQKRLNYEKGRADRGEAQQWAFATLAERHVRCSKCHRIIQPLQTKLTYSAVGQGNFSLINGRHAKWKCVECYDYPAAINALAFVGQRYQELT